MDALLKSQGLTQGSVAERVQALHKDPRFLLPNTDEGRSELLAKYQQILDEVMRGCRNIFGPSRARS